MKPKSTGKKIVVTACKPFGAENFYSESGDTDGAGPYAERHGGRHHHIRS